MRARKKGYGLIRLVALKSWVKSAYKDWRAFVFTLIANDDSDLSYLINLLSTPPKSSSSLLLGLMRKKAVSIVDLRVKVEIGVNKALQMKYKES